MRIMRSSVPSLVFLVITVSIAGYSVTSITDTARAAEEKIFDPVCGMELKNGPAATSEYDGSTYGFCSKMCKAKFEKEPEEFACFCGKSGHPDRTCPHCKKVAPRCLCGLEAEGHEEHEHHHEGGEHHHEGGEHHHEGMEHHHEMQNFGNYGIPMGG